MHERKNEMEEVLKNKLYKSFDFDKNFTNEKYEELEEKEITMLADLTGNLAEEFNNQEPFYYFGFPISRLSRNSMHTLVEYSGIFWRGIKGGRKALVYCKKEKYAELFCELISIYNSGIPKDKIVQKQMEKLNEFAH